jgi:hypothetical protein
VVFTLPPPVAAIAKQNKAVVYGLLFEAASETLKTIAADPRHLGAETGATMVLHTWGQTLTYHPHVHVIVPGGGLSLAPDAGGLPLAQTKSGNTWITCRPSFFLPIKVLQRLYRRLFLAKLAAAHASGRLQFFDALAPLSDPRAFARHLAPVRRVDWIVYVGPAGATAILSATTTNLWCTRAAVSIGTKPTQFPASGPAHQTP